MKKSCLQNGSILFSLEQLDSLLSYSRIICEMNSIFCFAYSYGFVTRDLFAVNHSHAQELWFSTWKFHEDDGRWSLLKSLRWWLFEIVLFDCKQNRWCAMINKKINKRPPERSKIVIWKVDKNHSSQIKFGSTIPLEISLGMGSVDWFSVKPYLFKIIISLQLKDLTRVVRQQMFTKLS